MAPTSHRRSAGRSHVIFAAMLVSSQKWRSIVETLDILADPGVVADLREADAEAVTGGGMDVEDVANSVSSPFTDGYRSA